MNYKRELPLPLTKNICGNKVDFCVEDMVLVDLKAKPFIKKNDYYQMRRYLHAAGLKLGLIINFRNSILKPRRILNPSLLRAA